MKGTVINLKFTATSQMSRNKAFSENNLCSVLDASSLTIYRLMNKKKKYSIPPQIMYLISTINFLSIYLFG